VGETNFEDCNFFITLSKDSIFGPYFNGIKGFSLILTADRETSDYTLRNLQIDLHFEFVSKGKEIFALY
jgi:hypothetical protein